MLPRKEENTSQKPMVKINIELKDRNKINKRLNRKGGKNRSVGRRLDCLCPIASG